MQISQNYQADSDKNGVVPKRANEDEELKHKKVTYIGKDNAKIFLVSSSIFLFVFFIPHFAGFWIASKNAGPRGFERNKFFGADLKVPSKSQVL